MKAIFTDKGQSSALVPYRNEGGALKYFLQKRTADAPVSPGMYGFFGGNREGGESPEETLEREIKEELVLDIKNYAYFSRYEYAKWIYHIFLLEADVNFESMIDVKEGECGAFLTIGEVLAEPKITDGSRFILIQINNYLTGKLK